MKTVVEWKNVREVVERGLIEEGRNKGGRVSMAAKFVQNLRK